MLHCGQTPISRRGDVCSPRISKPQDLLEIVNLEIHGCATPSGINRLCQLGMVVPKVFEVDDGTKRTLRFDAVEIDMWGYIIAGRVQTCLASEHPMIVEAREKIYTDQFLGRDQVIFETGYLDTRPTEELSRLHSRSAQDWQELL